MACWNSMAAPNASTALGASAPPLVSLTSRPPCRVSQRSVRYALSRASVTCFVAVSGKGVGHGGRPQHDHEVRPMREGSGDPAQALLVAATEYMNHPDVALGQEKQGVERAQPQRACKLLERRLVLSEPQAYQ